MAEIESDAVVAQFLEMLGITGAPKNRTQLPPEQQYQYRDLRHVMHATRGQFADFVGDMFERSNVATLLLGPAGPGDHLNVVGECEHDDGYHTVSVSVKHGDRTVARLWFEVFSDSDREY